MLPAVSLDLKSKSITTCSKTLSTDQREEEYLKPGHRFTQTPNAHSILIENYNQSNISVSSSEHLDFHRSLGQILLYDGY